MSRSPKRWVITGYPAKPPVRRGKGVTLPAMPARVRLHLAPGGTPLETSDKGLLLELLADLERAITWLEGQEAEAAPEAGAEPEPAA